MVKSFFKQKKEEFLQSRAANLKIKKKARAAYFREKEKVSIKRAEAKARQAPVGQMILKGYVSLVDRKPKRTTKTRRKTKRRRRK